MKSIIALVLLGVVVIALGFLFREEVAFINIYDTYYVASYLSISIFINYLLGFIVFVKGIRLFLKNNRKV